jgi:hypothetical protein
VVGVGAGEEGPNPEDRVVGAAVMRGGDCVGYCVGKQDGAIIGLNIRRRGVWIEVKFKEEVGENEG